MYWEVFWKLCVAIIFKIRFAQLMGISFVVCLLFFGVYGPLFNVLSVVLYFVVGDS
jgi:hypothetical protein